MRPDPRHRIPRTTAGGNRSCSAANDIRAASRFCRHIERRAAPRPGEAAESFTRVPPPQGSGPLRGADGASWVRSQCRPRKRAERCRVGTIILPRRIVGILPQVPLAQVIGFTRRTKSQNVAERDGFCSGERIRIEPEGRHPARQQFGSLGKGAECGIPRGNDE